MSPIVFVLVGVVACRLVGSAARISLLACRLSSLVGCRRPAKSPTADDKLFCRLRATLNETRSPARPCSLALFCDRFSARRWIRPDTSASPAPKETRGARLIFELARGAVSLARDEPKRLGRWAEG